MQKVRKLCTDKSLWMIQKYSAFEHVKIIGVLVGACMPYSSLNSHQRKVAE